MRNYEIITLLGRKSVILYCIDVTYWNANTDKLQNTSVICK